jgi:hypothetical protein
MAKTRVPKPRTRGKTAKNRPGETPVGPPFPSHVSVPLLELIACCDAAQALTDRLFRIAAESKVAS